MSGAMLANQTQVANAVQQGSVSVSFGGAGFLIFYYIGIVEVLSKLGVLKPHTKLAGASSGALITTSQCSGLSPPAIFSAGHALAKACRSERSCSGSLDRELRKTLQSYLPSDAWQKCKGHGFISISTGSPLAPTEPMLVSDYNSNDDLISAAAVSSFIPLWSGSSITTWFRGLQAYDGGYTQNQPCPPDVQYCIKVSARNPSWPQNRGIGSFLSLLGRLGEASNGQASGRTTESARSYPPISSTGPEGTADPSLVQLAADAGLDIAPGVFNKMPFSQEEWSNWALSPADDGSIHHMYTLGKKDAAAWAKLVGIKAKTLPQGEGKGTPGRTAESFRVAVEQKKTAAAKKAGKQATDKSNRRLKL